jgi:hypothetical protein
LEGFADKLGALELDGAKLTLGFADKDGTTDGAMLTLGFADNEGAWLRLGAKDGDRDTDGLSDSEGAILGEILGGLERLGSDDLDGTWLTEGTRETLGTPLGLELKEGDGEESAFWEGFDDEEGSLLTVGAVKLGLEESDGASLIEGFDDIDGTDDGAMETDGFCETDGAVLGATDLDGDAEGLTVASDEGVALGDVVGPW